MKTKEEIKEMAFPLIMLFVVLILLVTGTFFVMNIIHAEKINKEYTLGDSEFVVRTDLLFGYSQLERRRSKESNYDCIYQYYSSGESKTLIDGGGYGKFDGLVDVIYKGRTMLLRSRDYKEHRKEFHAADLRLLKMNKWFGKHFKVNTNKEKSNG